ncbi:Dolichyl-phosphate-mannose-protein mannosyltransferase [Methyloligella halotolerans]|uniref:Dolichyl-phosphate-mannose-protein mannosyltransferase n=1 Tax=Methyloligella halotolerans TaxID=1177755 RepID=A0A1E2RYR5_9HYPH|nr:glycosyltransferase family 39 protein [Methyloligella halotolerans]ODA67364.1 Dolichyl-phosphate-mannose-protein mannosyltransferase [Methyloligella halotolerans]
MLQPVDRLGATNPQEQGDRWTTPLLLVLSLITLVRLIALGFSQTDLYFDEAQYWSWAQDPSFGYFSKPPLIAWIIWATTSVCGDGEACVRISVPFFHAGSAIFLFLAGRALYDSRTGFWSAVIFATLPGISFSANIVSTDVPLLFCWSAALYFGVKLQAERRWRWALLLGLAIGLGALAKYAMLYFYLCAGIWLAVSPAGRWLLRDMKGLALLALPVLILVPNLIWNLDNGLVTFAHTADNAKLGGSLFHPGNMLEFLIAQLGVFGPFVFPMLIVIAVRTVRRGGSPEDRYLLAFSLPVLILVTVIAFLSRAHANWAAATYPAATILVTAMMLRLQRDTIFAATVAVNVVSLIVLAVAPAFADRLTLPGGGDPFARTMGWRQTAEVVRGALKDGDYGAIVTDDRAITAELLYYLRDSGVPILAWPNDGQPRDHYQLTRPFTKGTEAPVLLVTLREPRNRITRHFSTVEPVGVEKIAAGPKTSRTVILTSITGFKGG